MTHKQHHTYGDYLTWPDHPRQELIDGVAYVREPPAPSPCHQEMVGELFGQLWVALKGRPCRVYVAPFDVRLPKSDEANELIDTVVQPMSSSSVTVKSSMSAACGVVRLGRGGPLTRHCPLRPEDQSPGL